MINFKLFFWKLRKFKYFFSRKLVLDIGSGSNPYFSANVCFDKNINESYERDGDKIFNSYFNFTVISNGRYLPFKNGCFDRSILSHVLEYNRKPIDFLNEIFRVSNGGLIEGGRPCLFKEISYPHMSLICDYDKDNGLFVYKKKYKDDKCENFYKSNKSSHLDLSNPKSYHYRYDWKKIRNSVPFKVSILNDDYEFEWKEPNLNSQILNKKVINFKILLINLLILLRSIFFNIDIKNFLQCPNCKNQLIFSNETIKCSACESSGVINRKLIYFNINLSEQKY